MTQSDPAVKLLWQATDIDPTLNDAYLYLGLYYNSREDFGKVVEVYKKLIKYQPKQVSANLNIGEAYLSFKPPQYDNALPYYRKAYELDPKNTFAALRIGELLAQTGQHDDALKYLKIALGDSAKNPTVASEAERLSSRWAPLRGDGRLHTFVERGEQRAHCKFERLAGLRRRPSADRCADAARPRS